MCLPLLLLLALGIVAASAGCGLGGERGGITLGYAVDERVPSLPITEPLEQPIPVGREFLLRLEVPMPRDEEMVVIRISKRVGGSFLQRGDVERAVEPPWRIVALPLAITEPGEWLVSVFASQRKITDVKLEVR